jgi:hypothetical protein
MYGFDKQTRGSSSNQRLRPSFRKRMEDSMAHQDQNKKALGIGAIVAGALFALLTIVSVVWIFHPGGELPGQNQQFAHERARVPITPDVGQAPRAPQEEPNSPIEPEQPGGLGPSPPKVPSQK